MIVPDVNVLVYAFRREAPEHVAYRDWLAEAAAHEELGLVESVLLGVVRVATHPRLARDPAPTAAVLDFVAQLRAAARARPLPATAATWSRLAELVGVDRQVRGNLVPDAWLAALAISHGARLATADRGFARFPGLDWFVPA